MWVNNCVEGWNKPRDPPRAMRGRQNDIKVYLTPPDHDRTVRPFHSPFLRLSATGWVLHTHPGHWPRAVETKGTTHTIGFYIYIFFFLSSPPPLFTTILYTLHRQLLSSLFPLFTLSTVNHSRLSFHLHFYQMSSITVVTTYGDAWDGSKGIIYVYYTYVA